MKLPYTLIFAGTSSASAFVTPHQLANRGAKPLYSAVVAEEIAVTLSPTKEETVDTATSSSTTGGADDETISRPGLRENALFQCDPSVKYWRDFQSNGEWTARENLQGVVNVANRFAARGRPEAASYLLRHVGRSGYFAGNAILASLASRLHEQFINNDNNNINEDGGTATTTGGSILPFNMNSAAATRLLLEAFICYEQDYESIDAGYYREPWDMELNHRQSSPINMIVQTRRFVDEAIGTLARRRLGRDEDKRIWIDAASSSLYPEYYQTAFHYQTDGWMSKRSADVYETSTETLFLGRQDAMQRTSLPPIVQQKAKNRSKDSPPMKVLEVACGTGRFMTFIRDNLPLDTECVAVDLSPFYLEAARDNDAYWRKTKHRSGGSSDNIKPLRLIQAQAENLPFEDESFDAVVCTYLFHELPRHIRAKVASEMSRVLKKGGVLTLTDSIQRGDRPMLDEKISNFSAMNEPYYADYLLDDLPEHFVKEGIKPVSKTVRSTTKSLTFTK